MTEEEKKEFEEFLKWKAEKAKMAASTETEESSETPVEVDDTKTEKKCRSSKRYGVKWRC